VTAPETTPAPRALSNVDVGALLAHSLKPEEISGEQRELRVRELLRWFSRLTRQQANPKWLAPHAYELAYYVATSPPVDPAPPCPAGAEPTATTPICIHCGYDEASHYEGLSQWCRAGSGVDGSVFTPTPAGDGTTTPTLCGGGNLARFTRPVRPTLHCGDPSCTCMLPAPAPSALKVETRECCEAEHRSMLLALVRCILPAIDAGEMTPALQHQVKRLAATYNGEFSVRLAEAIVRRPPDPNEPRLIRSAEVRHE
jgi:hypothetical protein